MEQISNFFKKIRPLGALDDLLKDKTETQRGLAYFLCFILWPLACGIMGNITHAPTLAEVILFSPLFLTGGYQLIEVTLDMIFNKHERNTNTNKNNLPED